MIKIKVLTYTSYKEHCALCSEIHVLIAVNGCQIGLARKDIILLSDITLIAYGAASRMGVEDGKHIKFTISAGTYSTDDFNTEIKAAVSQQRSDWKAPQFKDLNLVIPDRYTFMTSNSFFIARGIPAALLKRLRVVNLLLPLVHTRHSLVHHLSRYYYQYTADKSIN